jgi:hypothetical protein
VYAGHAGIGLFATSRRPRVSIALLVPVAFAPDWIQWMLATLGVTRNSSISISHSLVSIVVGATAVAAGYWAVSRSNAGAAIVWLTYLSHWPADFITGVKPIWPGGRGFGLNLYQYPVIDAVIESLLVIACWVAYRRSLPVDGTARRMSWLIPVGLVALHIGFILIQMPQVKDPIRQMIPVTERF